jgi:1-deoxy-D-xylulose-5-phosphate reductoisomerase
LSWPDRIESGADLLDFTRLSALTFEEPCAQRYPGLQLAWQTLEGPEGSTCVLNAANEMAVAAFLDERIRFDQIHAVNAQTLSDVALSPGCVASVDALLDLDAQARRAAEHVVARLSSTIAHR